MDRGFKRYLTHYKCKCHTWHKYQNVFTHSLQIFEDIRKRFPHYRIGIIHVSASEATIRSRIAKRSAETGGSVYAYLMALINEWKCLHSL